MGQVTSIPLFLENNFDIKSSKNGLSEITTCLVPNLQKNDQIDITAISMLDHPIISDDENQFVKIVIKLLKDSDENLKLSKLDKSIELLQLATKFGSVNAATRLAYYFLALKFINNIPSSSWDLQTLLELMVGITFLYENYLSYQKDQGLWNYGIRTITQIDLTLNDAKFSKFLFHQDNEIRKAIRINILFCIALSHELDENYRSALKTYKEIEIIGKCGDNLTGKLIKKARTNYRLLEKKVPIIDPVCCECDYSANDLKEIWKLLV
ncbi:8520_t:CDS:2, partial [Entrophospora sp. SA101]